MELNFTPEQVSRFVRALTQDRDLPDEHKEVTVTYVDRTQADEVYCVDRFKIADGVLWLFLEDDEEVMINWDKVLKVTSKKKAKMTLGEVMDKARQELRGVPPKLSTRDDTSTPPPATLGSTPHV